MSVESKESVSTKLISEKEILKVELESKIKKIPMNLKAKEFVPKSSVKDSAVSDESPNHSVDEIDQNVDEKNQKKLSGDTSNNSNNTTSARPKSLSMNTSVLPDTNIPQTIYAALPPNPQQIYSMEFSTPNCLASISDPQSTAAGPAGSAFINQMPSGSPVIIQSNAPIPPHTLINHQHLNLFQTPPGHHFRHHINSGGSSPHSFQSVSPPILNNNNTANPLQNGSGTNSCASSQNNNSTNNTNGTNVTNPVNPTITPPQPANMSGEHYVMVHVNLGETFSIRVGDQIQNISGPATVRMVSNSGPPTPMPMQVPPGHMVQQIVDENGILTHVILSPLHQQPPPPPPPPQNPHTPCISHTQSPHHPSFYNHGPPPPPPPPPTAAAAAAAVGTTTNPIVTNTTTGQIYTTTSNYNQTVYRGGPLSLTPQQLHHTTNSNGVVIPNESVGKTLNTSTTDENSTTKSLNDENVHRKPQSQHKTTKNPPRSSQVSQDTAPHDRDDNSNYYDHQFPLYTTANANTNTSASSTTIPNSNNPSSGAQSTNASHHQYNKYRKRRHFPGKYNYSASANTKHHYMPDNMGSSISNADDVGTILTDEEKNAIRDVLNTIEKPEVSEIESRSALIHIVCPKVPDNCLATINSADFTFQLHFAERNPESRYNCVFYGEAVEISLQDLKPATDYYVKVCCIYENITGHLSSYNKFTTLCTKPNAPKPPVLQTKSKNSIHVKWTSPVENGSKVSDYVLEYIRMDANSDNFHQAYRGTSKTYKIQKLKPSTEYLIRLAAINNYGQSAWSELISISTSGTPPPAPDPPVLARADTNGLLLSWKKRATSTSLNTGTSNPATVSSSSTNNINDETTFCLDMMDEATGYGFITVFNGPEVEHYVENLRRNTQYRFRLSASNQDGRSKWSEVVTMTTKPDVPGPPHRLHIKGNRTQPTSFVLVWEAPEDDGGLPIEKYKLELDATSCTDSNGDNNSGTTNTSGNEDWEVVYTGDLREFTCRNQQPGSYVLARVSACSSGGFWGSPTPSLKVHLASQSPSCMNPPRKDIGSIQTSNTTGNYSLSSLVPAGSGGSRKHTSSSFSSGLFLPGTINLIWEPPEKNGGSPITGYELCQWTLKITNRLNNKDSIASSMLLDNNGNIKKLEDKNLIEEVIEETEEQIAYNGSQFSCQISGLIPGARYRYRIRALNSAGKSKWSNYMDCTSGPSAPEAPRSGPAVTCKSPYIVMISWSESVSSSTSKNCTNTTFSTSNSNDGVSEYRVEYKTISNEPSTSNTNTSLISNDYDLVYSGSQVSYELRNLQPHTTYAFRLQIGNNAGLSPHSPVTEVTTPAAPPSPVQGVKVTNLTLNSLQLDWREPSTNGSPISGYMIEGVCSHCQNTTVSTPNNSATSNLSNSGELIYKDLFTLLTEGTEKVISDLLPDTSYKFRVKAVNSVGPGPYSQPIKANTLSSPPAPPQLELAGVQSTSIKLKWHNSVSPRQYYISKLLSVNGSNNNSGATNPHLLHPGYSGSEPNVSQYQLQMSRQPDSGWSNIYTGSLQFHKHSKLLESTNYYFRIMASNEVGSGDYSEPILVCTEKAAPATVRIPKITNISNDSCTIEWPALRSMNNDPIVYILQLLNISEKDSDYKQQWKQNGKEIYRGSETTFTITQLTPGTEYMTRVCAVRLCSPSTIVNAEDIASSRRSSNNEESANMTGHSLSEHNEESTHKHTNSSPVTELSGAFSKCVSFTTLGRGVNPSSVNIQLSQSHFSLSSPINTAPLYPYTTNPHQYQHHSINTTTTGSAAITINNTNQSRNPVNLLARSAPIKFLQRQFLDRIGPWTDNHFIVLILILFTIFVLVIANLIQVYLK